MILSILAYGALAIGSLFLTAWIFSIIFQSRKLIKYQEVQTELMIKIAERQGVPPDEISGVINHAFPGVQAAVN